MSYYHDLVTQKSWEELIILSRLTDFILIGGWAVYLYTKSLKSKDIDIIADFDQLSVLKKHYNIYKNDRLKKYEAKKMEVQIDIYLPYYSTLGIPVEVLMTRTKSIETFKTIDPDYLFALKIFTLSQRGRTAKGRKDFVDLISLAKTGICNLQIVKNILNQYKLSQSLTTFKELLGETEQIEELDLNSHSFSKLKKRLFADFL